MATQDFIVTDQACVWLFEPLTEAAQRFVREKLNVDEWLWVDRRFAVDYLAAGALTECVSACNFDPLIRGIGVQN